MYGTPLTQLQCIVLLCTLGLVFRQGPALPEIMEIKKDLMAASSTPIVLAVLAEAESGRRRKYYRITSEGRAQLAEDRKQWQAVDATLRGVWRGLALSVASAAPLAQGA